MSDTCEAAAGTGVHTLEADAYHGDPCPAPSLSSTLARKMLNQSPLHAWTASPRLNPDWEPQDKKTFDIGRAAHREVLGAGSDYAVIPENALASNGAASTKEAKAFIAEAREAGLTPIKAEEADQVQAMAAKVSERLAEMGILLEPERSELAAIAELDGAWCRAMIDNAPADPAAALYDFKTTTDASPDACLRAVMNYGYDVQAAHYRDTWRAATGEDRAFRFIMQEKEPPFEVCVVELGGESLMMAHKKIARAREMWAICVRDEHWPGYPLGIHRIELPEFFHGKWLERESAEAEHKRRTGMDVLERARRWQAPETFAQAGE